MKSNNSPIIITGTQRSGTTLLHHIVGCSKTIWSRNEMYEVHRLIFDKVRGCRETLLRDQLQSFLGVELEKIPFTDTTIGRCRLLAEAMQRAAEEAAKITWCLKDPRATYYLPEYAQALPSVRFVVLVRDPRAVCRSYLDGRGFTVGRPANWLTGAERWTHEVRRQLKHHQQHPDRVLIIRYDQLVKNMEREVSKLCKFLEIEFDPKLLEYYKHTTKIKIHGGNENILSPPDPTKINAWEKKLSKKQIQIIESVAQPTMNRLGYEPLYPAATTSGLYRTACRLHDSLVREFRWRRHKWRSRASV